MGILDDIMGRKVDEGLRVPNRSRKAPFMNLAYKKVPTVIGTWTTDPAGLANLTDEDLLSHLSTDGVTTTTAGAQSVRIDLGQIHEVYQINIKNTSGNGVKANNASNAGTLKLKADTSATPSTQRGTTQTPAGTAFEDIDASKIGYDGEGIDVRYVLVELVPDGTYFMTLDISEIEVFGA